MLEQVIDHFLERFAGGSAGVAGLLADAQSGKTPLMVQEARAGSLPATLALLARRTARPLLVVTNSLDRAEMLTDGLQFFGVEPLIFPAFETLPYETQEPVLHIMAARNRVLAALGEAESEGDSSRPRVIVAPVDALFFRTLPAEQLGVRGIHIRWGEPCDLEDLARRLVALGFTREGLVESPGEFSIRGSIADIFPPDAELPWRLDFFGDELEQIRKFDPATQRSLPQEGELEGVEILPNSSHAPKLAWLEGGERLASFFDLLPGDTLLALDGPGRIAQRVEYFQNVADRHWRDLDSHREDATERPIFLDRGWTPGHWLLNDTQLRAALESFQAVQFADLSVEVSGEGHAIKAQTFDTIPAKFEEYLELFQARLKNGHWIMIVCDNNGQVMRLDELLRERDLPAAPLIESALPEGIRPNLPFNAQDRCPQVLLSIGELHEGFQHPEAKILVITDREIFGRYKKRHVYRKTHRGRKITDPTEIKRDDCVVHVEHGIGIYNGIRRQLIDGRIKEFLELLYQDGDKLLVPVDKLHMVQKYAGAEGKEPVLDKLGGKKWGKRRQKSLEAVRKMAGELLELYARREAAEGHEFGPDNTWMQEFESSFLYRETPDQLEAIKAVKKDMMKLKPMDRLVCGDVGYGKTEVAIRAAFKALCERKQVAVLAPTTLLVQQHYTNFKERFADYPFRVGMLSRFKSAKEQREEIQRIEKGEVDLVIGTHRLLSRDVKFRDLGLLVVDEEQRFGVAQKEKIKNFKTNVDILTLSATPIPRTLYMALSGLRDLSIINTPPANRHPVKTRTVRFDRDLIEEAILREMNRGGQVYFVHNRVENIQEITTMVREIVPTAKVQFAHGQMEEEQLEKIMMSFIDGEFDILVSTTIIENGIDIPNVNTMIINRADTFGLAQLYQLRGRVGRDVRQAYAYLILPKGEELTPTAVKRLEALEEFTDLGVGFSIAMRDMEIRGTGNILGKEQHGAITDIGYEMYCRMLAEAVQELRGMPVREQAWPVEIKWAVDQFIPEEFIPVESQRIRIYKNIAGAVEHDTLLEVSDELLDRYGAIPQPVKNLLALARLRIAGSAWRLDKITPAPDGSIRIVAEKFGVELATALAEDAPAYKSIFRALKRQGKQVILTLRNPEETTPEEALAATADLLGGVPPLEIDFGQPVSDQQKPGINIDEWISRAQQSYR